MTDVTFAYAADIVKTERDTNGDLLVYGKATGSDRDSDGQRCRASWLKTAMPRWGEWANLREMHQPIAAGIGVEITNDGDDWYVKSKAIDPVTVRKLEAGVLKGYSIGIKSPIIEKVDGEEWISGGEICEISYVDRPALGTAKITLCKMVGGSLKPVEAVDAKTGPPIEPPTPAKFTPADMAKIVNKVAAADPVEGDDSSGDALDDALVGMVRAHLGKRKFTAEEREQAAADGDAMDDGSYPITTITDLRNAIRLAGHGKDPRKARAHIKRRARALGRTDLIPEAWKAADPDLTKDDGEQVHDPALLADIRDGLAELIRCELDELCDGEFELYDIEQLLITLRMFMQYWSGEAAGGETESPYTMKTLEADMTTALAADTKKTVTPAVPDVAAAEAVTAAARTAEPTEPAAAAGAAGAAGVSPAVAAAVTPPAAPATPDPGAATKAANPDTPTDLAELVKSAIADAQKPFMERITALEADLQKALALPEPGGPVITRTAAQTAVARDTDHQAQITGLLEKAARYDGQNRALAQGYRDWAAELTAQRA